MPRNETALRVLEIGRLLELAPHGLTIKELQARLNDRGFKATNRTVYRDVEAATQFFPIFEKEKTESGGIRYSMESVAKITKYLALHPRELFALYFSRGVLQPLENTPFYTDIQATFQKIDVLLGQRGREYLDELASSLFFEPGPKWGLGLSPDVIETIRAACEERHVLLGVYVSTKDNAPKKRRLGPHFLYYAKGGIYLVAEDLDTKQIKTYSLPRFHSVQMAETGYETQPLNPSEFFASSFGVFSATEVEEVEMEFEPSVARFVSERQWHASQRVVNLDQGKARVSFSIAVTPEFVAWVLGFGPDVRVTKSDKLIKLLVEQATKVREMYWKNAG